MDVLSDVISVVRLGRPSAARVEWVAPWRQRFPDRPGTAGFLVVLEGSCWIRRGDGDREDTSVRLGPGDVLFSPHGAGYTLTDRPPDGPPPPPGSRTVTVCGGYDLAPDRTHPLLRELPRTVHLPSRVGRHPELRTTVEILGAEAGGERPGAAALLPAALDLLLLYTLRACLERPTAGDDAPSNWAAALAHPAVAAALDAMHTHPEHPWTVQGLADRSRSSRAALARRFTELIGQPPLSYLTWWRMILATDLLRDPALSVAEVARRVGYTSEFAFATAFKRENGVTPGTVRRAAGARTSTFPVHDAARSGGNAGGRERW